MLAKVLFSVVIATGCVALASCAAPPPIRAPVGVTLEPIKIISRLQSSVLLRVVGIKGVSAKHDVDCYRVTYPSHDRAGREVVLSGLLALPHGITPQRLVSFQHGTTTSRDGVPSALDGTGTAAAIIFGGNGYALVAPDYIGLGKSLGRHSYLVADAQALAVVDMINAVRRLPRMPSNPVFLSGFSEGGQATMAAMRMIEASGQVVLGAGAVAGPYDLRHRSLDAAMQGRAASHPLYLAYMSWGYADYYGHPLNSVLTPEYAIAVEDLLGKPHSQQQIMAGLPTDPHRLFTREFLKAYEEQGSHWLLDALAMNDLTDWTPRAPVRFYFGSADRDVSPREALDTADVMHARGADVEAVNVGPVGHDPSMLSAAPQILALLRRLDRP